MNSIRQITLLTHKERIVNLEHLEQDGLTLVFSEDTAFVDKSIENDNPTLVVVDLSAFWAYQCTSIIQKCSEYQIPVLGILPEEFELDLIASLNLADFIFSPFTNREFTMRIQRLVSRQSNTSESNTINIGAMRIDLDRYEVTISGNRVLLTYKEFQLLCLMADSPGRVYSREALLSSVWGYDYFGGTRTVDVHIRRLRSKIEDNGSMFIETIRNVGYRFNQSTKY